MSRKSRNRERSIPPVSGGSPVPLKGATPRAATGTSQAGQVDPRLRVMRFNTRFLFITAVLGLCVAAGIHVAHGYSVERNADQLLKRAWDADAQGDAELAVRWYTQYLRLTEYEDPEEMAEGQGGNANPAEPRRVTDIVERIGTLMDQEDPSIDEMVRIYRTFEEVLRRDPERVQIRRRLVAIAISFGRFRDAATHLEKLLPADPSQATADDAVTARLLGESYARLGASPTLLKDAQKHLLNAIDWDPANSDAYLLLSALWLEHPQQADLKAASGISELAPYLSDSSDGENGTSELATRAAYEILDAMVAEASSRELALLRKAEMLLSASNQDDAAPMAEEFARKRARELLDSAEGAVAAIPAFADLNLDGAVTEDELALRLMRGDQISRLVEAERAADLSLSVLEEGADAIRRSNAALLAIRINLSLDEIVPLAGLSDEDPLAVLDYFDRARSLSRSSLSIEHANPQVYTVAGQLALGESAQIEPGDVNEHVYYLNQAIDYLEIGLDHVEELAAQSTSTSQSRWDPWARAVAEQPALQTMRFELQWQLFNVRLSKAVVLGDTESLQDRFKDAYEALTAVAADSGIAKDDPQLRYLQARLDLSARKWKEALSQFERLRLQFAEGSSLWRSCVRLLGACFDQAGNPDAKLDLFRVSLLADPLWSDGYVGEAEALIALGRIDEAISRYERVSAVSGVMEKLAALELNRLDGLPAERRDFGRVERLLNVATSDKPETEIPQPSSHRQAALIAELLMIRAVSQWNQSATAGDSAGQAAASALLDRGQEVLTTSRDTRPWNPESWGSLALFVVRRPDLDPTSRLAQARDILEQGAQLHTDSIVLRLTAIDIASLQPPEEALKLLIGLDLETNGLSEDEQLQLHQVLATAYSRAGDHDSAIRSWQRAAELRPDEFQPHAAIVQLVLYLANRTDDGINESLWNEHFGQLAAIEEDLQGGQGPLTALFLAQRRVFDVSAARAAEQSTSDLSLDEAENWLQAAAQLRPHWSVIPKWLGVIAQLESQVPIAAAHYERAYELGDRSPDVVRWLMAYYDSQAGSHDAAIRGLSIAKRDQLYLEINRDVPRLITGDIARQAIDLLMDRGQYAEAIGVAEDLSAASGNAEDRILLAVRRLEVLRKSFDMPRAAREAETAEIEALFIEATQMAPSVPNTWTWLVSFYSRVGRANDAEQALARAAEAIPDEPPHVEPLTLGFCREIIAATIGLAKDEVARHIDLARIEYDRALQTDPSDPGLNFTVSQFHSRQSDPEAAVRLLEQILSKDDALSLADRAMVVIAKARSLAASGTRSDTDAALELLQATEWPDEATRLGALRVQALILDRRNGPGDWRRLLAILEEIAGIQRLSLSESLVSAALYEIALGDWPRAQGIYEELLRADAGNADVLASLIHGLLRHANGDQEILEEARQHFRNLSAIQPDNYRTRSIEARLMAADGQASEAAAMLARFVRQELLESPAAALVEEIDEAHLAEVSEHLADVARQQGDDVALQVLSDISRDAAEGRFQQAIVALNGLAQAQWLVAEIRTELLNSAARLTEEIGELAVAETLYREYADTSSRAEAILSLIRFLGRQDRHSEALALCEAHWNELPAQVIGGVAIGLIRHGAVAEPASTEIAAHLDAALVAATEDAQKIELLRLLADLRDYQLRFDDAQSIYLQILGLDPDHVIALNNLAWLMARSGRAAEAMQLVARAVEKAGPYPELLDTTAVVLLEAGRTAEAVALLEEAIADRPLPEAYFHLAEAHARAGSVAASQAALKKSDELGLDPAALHPLDRERYQQLTLQLSTR